LPTNAGARLDGADVDAPLAWGRGLRRQRIDVMGTFDAPARRVRGTLRATGLIATNRPCDSRAITWTARVTHVG